MFPISGRLWFYFSSWTVNLLNESHRNFFHSNQLALLWLTILSFPQQMQQIYFWRSHLSHTRQTQALSSGLLANCKPLPRSTCWSCSQAVWSAALCQHRWQHLCQTSCTKNPPFPFKGITFYGNPKCRFSPQLITYLRHPRTSHAGTALQGFLLTRWM